MSRLNIPLVLLAVVYLIIGTLYALRTPDWQSPDEPAHYNYIAQIVSGGCCPVIEVGDWDQGYIERLTANRFSPATLAQLDTVQYEDHQPPLYYLLLSVVYRLTNGSLFALRLFSVLIGMGVILAAYAVARTLLMPPLALTAAAFVAFLPQHIAILASVNNDGLSELVIGLTLLATIHYLRGNALGMQYPLFRKTWVLGILVGVGLLTKINTAFLVGVVPLVLVLQWWVRRRTDDVSATERITIRQLLQALILFIVPALLLAGIWWARNLSVYGVPDFLGLRQHDLVVADQPRTADQIAAVGLGEYLRAGFERTFVSFWGQFGWMALPINDWMLWLAIGFTALVASGWLVGWFVRRSAPASRSENWRKLAWTLLVLTVVAVLVQYAYYNTEFYQMQGRYLFPMLIPLGTCAAVGLDGWRRLLFGRGEHWQWAAVVPVLLLIPLNLYILWRVLPLLAPGD